MKRLLVIIFLATYSALAVAQGATQASSDIANAKFRNPALPIDDRVNDLIARMTLEEKVSQMRDRAVGIPRLGVPPYEWWNEGLHGVAFAGYATNFPQVIGMAATWDTDLVHRMAEVISTEARAKYNQAMRDDQHERFFGLTFWAPNINIFRDPRWGRGQETYGEDPFLTGRMAVAFVSGMQGADPKYFRVVSTPKHYAVHSGPEPLRHGFNVDVSPHDFEDTYLPAFRAAEPRRMPNPSCAPTTRLMALPPAPALCCFATTFAMRGTLMGMSSAIALPSRTLTRGIITLPTWLTPRLPRSKLGPIWNVGFGKVRPFRRWFRRSTTS